MDHPDEHILELYVLNADAVSGRRAEIGEHLGACAGCRMLAKEISGFYAELDAELRKADMDAGEIVGKAIAKRNTELAVWEERLARSRWSGWASPVRNARYFIRRYPISAAGATLAFAALAALAFLAGPRPRTEKAPADLNPAYISINLRGNTFDVYNGQNELLWKRANPGSNLTRDIENHAGTFRYAVIDMDDDGINEVVTGVPLDGMPRIPDRGLHVFDGGGQFHTLSFERKVAFRGKPYEMPVSLEGGTLILIDSTDPEDLKLFLTVKNDRSPNAIVRMNRKGEVLGEYWHQGQFAAAYLEDLDGDGRRDLVLCGFNDVDDDIELAKPIVAVLDPEKITGVTESRLTRGYGFAGSTAERYYIKLPMTELNHAMYKNAGMARMTIHDSSVVFLWNSLISNEVFYDLDFVFTRKLEPTRVVSNTQTQQLFEREFDAGHIDHRLDAAALEKLRSEVRFWDGERWVGNPVRLAAGSPH